MVPGYLVDAKSEIRRYSLAGKALGTVQLPGIGSVSVSARQDDECAFISFSSFTHPREILRYSVSSGTIERWWSPKLEFCAEDYETTQTFASSKDGTRVPMFITARKGTRLDGSNPTLLTGYGGFNVSITPWFPLSQTPWLRRGGVLAVANLRGGAEYGEHWHEAAMLDRKQNTFDDFIAAAEHLISSGWTSRRKLAIEGASNGGLLVGAAITQRPDLFHAAVVKVGVLDMLRFQKYTIGWAWKSEYGSSDDPEQFRFLLKYSPLHNLHKGTAYPATLIITGDHDDRVVPAHSFKFAAALQTAQGGPAPVLIRVETAAGHGGGKPLAKTLRESADELAFLIKETFD